VHRLSSSARHLQRRYTPSDERWNYGQEMADKFYRHVVSSTPRVLLHATCDRRLYFPSERRHAEDFFALKNPASAGFEPAILGTRCQHAKH
jgi:hypothetical protein